MDYTLAGSDRFRQENSENCQNLVRHPIQATVGKVFTLATMDLLIEHMRISEHRVW